MLTKEMVVSPKSHVYVAAYNAIVFVRSVDGEYVVIGDPCCFYEDAYTNIVRYRVRRDILERMGYPVVVGENVQEYDMSHGYSTNDIVLRVKDIHGLDGIDRDRARDDCHNRVGLYFDSEELPWRHNIIPD